MNGLLKRDFNTENKCIFSSTPLFSKLVLSKKVVALVDILSTSRAGGAAARCHRSLCLKAPPIPKAVSKVQTMAPIDRHSLFAGP